MLTHENYWGRPRWEVHYYHDGRLVYHTTETRHEAIGLRAIASRDGRWTKMVYRESFE